MEKGWKKGCKKGCLTVLFVLSIGWVIVFFSASFTEGPEERGPLIGAGVVSLVVASGIGIYLWHFRNREKLEQRKELYKRKLKQWEEEGYDVSELKDKWFKEF